MSDDTVVATVVLASAADARDGLLAWSAVEVAGVFRCDGLAIRRTSGNRPRLVVRWPRRRAASGETYPVVTIMVAGFRQRVEAEVLASYLDAVRRADPRTP